LRLTLILILTNSPLFICLITILQCLIIAAVTWYFRSDVWLIILLLLIYFGGVIVLLIYICTLAQRDKFILHPYKVYIYLPATIIIDSNLPRWASDSLANPETNIVNIFHSGYSFIVGVLILYLLIGLVVVVKITKFYKGALRQI
jgi:NADH-ubiquinone oxidoreductase chain 6